MNDNVTDLKKAKSTLQRLEDAEKAINEVKGAITVTQALSTQVPKLEQDVAAIGKNVGELINQANYMFGQQQQMLQTVANQNVALEQSVIQLGRTITALSEELIETHGLSSDGITRRMRKMEEDTERQRMENMLKYKAIKPTEVVNEKSVVVVEEVFTAKAEQTEGSDLAKSKKIYDYRVLEMSSQYNDANIVASFVGKKVTETVSIDVEGGTVLLTIKEIYEYAQEIKGSAESSVESAAEQKAEEVSNDTTANT